MRSAYLPYRYRSYDLYSGYKVVLTDYHGNAPYNNYKWHKANYAKGYRGDSQRTIGEKPGNGKHKIGHNNNNKQKKDQGHNRRKGKKKNH
jgi:hypothetical protein